MKFLAITLALAIFAGSLVSIRGDERRSMLTQLRIDVEGYVETVVDGVAKQCTWLLSLNASRQLVRQISSDFNKVGDRMNTLHQKLPVQVTRIVDPVIETAVQMKSIAFGFAFITGQKLEMYPELVENLGHWAEPTLEKVRGQAEALSARIQKSTKKEEEALKWRLEELKAHKDKLESFVGEVHNQWLELQKSLALLADWLKDDVVQTMEAMNVALKRYVASIRGGN